MLPYSIRYGTGAGQSAPGFSADSQQKANSGGLKVRNYTHKRSSENRDHSTLTGTVGVDSKGGLEKAAYPRSVQVVVDDVEHTMFACVFGGNRGGNWLCHWADSSDQTKCKIYCATLPLQSYQRTITRETILACTKRRRELCPDGRADNGTEGRIGEGYAAVGSGS
ncbi:hypothetical protein QTP88_019239 [Uroleucon formosanum]